MVDVYDCSSDEDVENEYTSSEGEDEEEPQVQITPHQVNQWIFKALLSAATGLGLIVTALVFAMTIKLWSIVIVAGVVAGGAFGSSGFFLCRANRVQGAIAHDQQALLPV